MSEPRMSREERDRNLDLRGADARAYYNRQMREADRVIISGQRAYEAGRRAGFVHPKDR